VAAGSLRRRCLRLGHDPPVLDPGLDLEFVQRAVLGLAADVELGHRALLPEPLPGPGDRLRRPRAPPGLGPRAGPRGLRLLDLDPGRRDPGRGRALGALEALELQPDGPGAGGPA